MLDDTRIPDYTQPNSLDGVHPPADGQTCRCRLNAARRELRDRLRAYPFHLWSSALLLAVVALIDEHVETVSRGAQVIENLPSLHIVR